MNGTLSITGELSQLSKLAKRIDSWSSGALDTEIRPDGWGGWNVDTMSQLLERVHPWQLLLVSYVAAAGGRRPDADVRRNFGAGSSGLRGQTGAISKHVEAMKKAGSVPTDASHVIRVDRQTNATMFEIPESLVPMVQSALAVPLIAKRLRESAESEKWTEK